MISTPPPPHTHFELRSLRAYPCFTLRETETDFSVSFQQMHGLSSDDYLAGSGGMGTPRVDLMPSGYDSTC